MAAILASPTPTDLSGSQWGVILIALLAIGTAGVLALIPIAAARSRRHRLADWITVAALAWGVVAAYSVIQFCLAAISWKKEYTQDIMTGYVDPRTLTGAPAWPWPLWAALAACYVALLVYSRWQSNRE